MAKKTKRIINEPPENAPQMFAMAKSDISVARDGKIHSDTLYETLCMLCQQAIEKSLKALIIHNNIGYPADHSIEELIDYIDEKKIALPYEIKESAIAFVTIEGGFSLPLRTPITFGNVVPLSEYAGNRRYSLSETPLTEQDYKNVLARAEKIVHWVEQQIQK